MILTYEEIRKAAEFAAEQMWPESGYVGWTEDDAVFHRKFIEACFEKLRQGVELPEAFGLFCGVRHYPPKTKEFWGMLNKDTPQETKCNLFTRDQLIQYGAAQRLAGREQAIEECAAECLVLHANGNYKYDTRQDCHDAIRALAASPQEQTCTWTESDDSEMPGTYASSCGEMWSFTDGGVKENRVTYCHHCGGKVASAPPQEQT